jgi:DNA polymerase-3 subunit epsilon
MSLIADATFVVTDIETTGLSAERDRITEVACVYVVGGEIAEERRTLVNPERFIPQAIQEMTGISNAMTLGAPKGAEIFPVIREWFPAETTFAAHNAPFDFNFLQASFRRHGVEALATRPLCTARMARRILPARKSWSLAHLAAYFGVKVRGRHTALGDARATVEVLLDLLEILQGEHNVESVADVISFQYRNVGSLGKPTAKGKALAPLLSELPHRPGVYRMIDRRGDVIYIGKAKSLRDRVSSYFRPGSDHTAKIREMVRRVHTIETEETGSDLAALLLESKLIKRHQPKYNTLQKRIRSFAFVRLDMNDRFPTVSMVREVEADGAEYFGPFAGRSSAEALIEIIQDVFHLRKCEGPLEPSLRTIPCLYHQMHRCGAPCALLESPQEYAVEVGRLREFLSGSEMGILTLVEEKMRAHAEALEFEEAAALRDRMTEMQKIFQRKQRIADSVNTNNVVIVLPSTEAGKVEVFMIRFGRLARQLLVSRRFPEVTISRLIDETYFDGAAVPPHYRREEIDEVRIIASYLFRHRESGSFLYVEPADTVESLCVRVKDACREVR